MCMCDWFLSQMERVSKTCHFNLGQYCLALLNSPQEEAYKQLFEGLHTLGQKKPRQPYWPIFHGLVCQDLYLHGL